MEKELQQFQHLEIQLEEIKLATNNFDDEKNCIGRGGFGKVYKGEISHSKGRSMAAIKRLDSKNGQGIPEFLKEIRTLSRYTHENLISLLGFCYEGNEMILVYEHESHGSLDRHLSSPHLTWSQRIQICIDAAKGLSYLHDPRGTHQRLIHCDVKSSNILLDDHWKAKVSDFGLSTMGPANEEESVIVTLAVGTFGYYDPQYAMTHTLTKESDVYSFGVVLFEVLCGTLCCRYDINGRLDKKLAPIWIKCYEQNKLNDIIFKSPTIKPLKQTSLETLSNIAYRCLKESREDRPKMAEVVTELESALEWQQLPEGKLPRFFYREIAKTAKPPLSYTSEAELKQLMRKGVLLNGGKTWFSLNKTGEHCELISFAECLDSDPTNSDSDPTSSWLSRFRLRTSNLNRNVGSYDSRFAVGTYTYEDRKFKTRVKSQFLSPLTTYTVNLVFKFNFPARKWQLISLKYKLQGEKINSTSYLAYEREDGWWACELYQFTTHRRFVELEILFDGSDNCYDFIEVEGIEFRPFEKVEHRDEKQLISDSDEDWEEKLPTDYQNILKWSKDNVQWTTKKEAYSILRRGFLIDDGEKWFSLDINGKKCHMLSAANISSENKDELFLSESRSFRFREAVLLSLSRVTIDCNIQSHLLSSQSIYETYLVYKLSENKFRFEGPLEVSEIGSYDRWYIYLVSPQTPVIRSKADQNTHNPVHRPKIKGIPQLRKDGWMEVQIWEFQTTSTTKMPKMIRMCLQLTPCDDTTFKGLGLIIQGVESRPL